MPRIFEESVVVIQQSGGGGTPFTDAVTFKFNFADSVAAPTDAATFNLTENLADSVAAPTDTVTLKLPSPPDFVDSIAAPTETRSFTMRIWLSGTTMDSTNGVTNPANMNGQNDAAVATFTSQAAGDANPRTHSALGANVPAGVTVSAAIYRGWFKSVNTLVTSTTKLVMHSTSALFADITMFSNTALNTTVDHSTGDFTFDLVAAGVNTLAKLQSCQLLASTQDAVAGVTPAVLTCDAGAIELAGAF